MAISVIFLNQVLTVDGGGVGAHPNWVAADTVVQNKPGGQGLYLSDQMSASHLIGNIREFAVSNVAADRTIAYIEAGTYLFRVVTAGQSIKLRMAVPTLLRNNTAFQKGDLYSTDAADSTDPTGTTGETVYGQPVNLYHHTVRETEGPRRITVGVYTKIGMVASALATSVEVELAG